MAKLHVHTSDRVNTKQYDLSKCTGTISDGPAALLLAKTQLNMWKKLQSNIRKGAFKMMQSDNINSQILHRVNKLQTSTAKLQWFTHRVKTRTVREQW